MLNLTFPLAYNFRTSHLHLSNHQIPSIRPTFLPTTKHNTMSDNENLVDKLLPQAVSDNMEPTKSIKGEDKVTAKGDKITTSGADGGPVKDEIVFVTGLLLIDLALLGSPECFIIGVWFDTLPSPKISIATSRRVSVACCSKSRFRVVSIFHVLLPLNETLRDAFAGSLKLEANCPSGYKPGCGWSRAFHGWQARKDHPEEACGCRQKRRYYTQEEAYSNQSKSRRCGSRGRRRGSRNTSQTESAKCSRDSRSPYSSEF